MFESKIDIDFKQLTRWISNGHICPKGINAWQCDSLCAFPSLGWVWHQGVGCFPNRDTFNRGSSKMFRILFPWQCYKTGKLLFHIFLLQQSGLCPTLHIQFGTKLWQLIASPLGTQKREKESTSFIYNGALLLCPNDYVVWVTLLNLCASHKLICEWRILITMAQLCWAGQVVE